MGSWQRDRRDYVARTSLANMHWPPEMTRKPQSPRFATSMLAPRMTPTHAVHEPGTALCKSQMFDDFSRI